MQELRLQTRVVLDVVWVIFGRVEVGVFVSSFRRGTVGLRYVAWGKAPYLEG